MILPVIVLIFSRDRAMQLDAVLRSFFAHCLNCDQIRMVVLFQATTSQHARQYRALREAYPQVNFYQQRHFQRDVLHLLAPYPPASREFWAYCLLNIAIASLIAIERLPLRLVQAISYRLRTRLLAKLFPAPADESYILFLVDDNIFVRQFSLTDIVRALQHHPDALGFSLRLGRNTTYCYALDKPQALPEFTALNGWMLIFEWTAAELDFAYPLEISSSIYRAGDIIPIIASRPFSNPNELEYQIAVSAAQFAKKMPSLLCPEQSYTFCNPQNLVQNFVPNRAASTAGYSSQHLADLFDQGQRIRVEAYEGLITQSCHQEVPLKFHEIDIGTR